MRMSKTYKLRELMVRSGMTCHFLYHDATCCLPLGGYHQNHNSASQRKLKNKAGNYRTLISKLIKSIKKTFKSINIVKKKI